MQFLLKPFQGHQNGLKSFVHIYIYIYLYHRISFNLMNNFRWQVQIDLDRIVTTLSVTMTGSNIIFCEQRLFLHVSSSLTTCHKLNFSLWHNWVWLWVILTAAAPICNLGWWGRCIFRLNVSQPPVIGQRDLFRRSATRRIVGAHGVFAGGAEVDVLKEHQYVLYTYFRKWKHGAQGRAGQRRTEWREKATVLMWFHKCRKFWH